MDAALESQVDALHVRDRWFELPRDRRLVRFKSFSTTRDGICGNGMQSSGVSDSKAIVLFTDSQEKETVAKLITVILGAALAAVSIASPALAQYASQMGTIAVRHSGHVRLSSHRSGVRALASVPRSVDDPALTGGGSSGYNESLRLNHW